MGPFKCPDCGVWWAGFEHRCAPTSTLPGTGYVLRFGDPYPIGGNSTTSSMPWCGICAGWHLPGFGPCTGTYTELSDDNYSLTA